MYMRTNMVHNHAYIIVYTQHIKYVTPEKFLLEETI